MKIVVDGMGGDNAPVEILKGCALAVKEYGVEIIVTGDEAQIKKAAEDNSIDMTNITVEPADGVVKSRRALETYDDIKFFKENGEKELFARKGVPTAQKR